MQSWVAGTSLVFAAHNITVRSFAAASGAAMSAETVQAAGSIAISNSRFVNNTAGYAGAIDCLSARMSLHEVRDTLVPSCSSFLLCWAQLRGITTGIQPVAYACVAQHCIDWRSLSVVR